MIRPSAAAPPDHRPSDGYESLFPPAMAVGPASIRRRSPPGKPRVLVVDDAKEITELFLRWLETEYDVTATASGRQAYELAYQLTPAVIVIDVVLPDINGLELAEALRELPPLASTPVIFISGLRHPANAQRAVELGALDFLQKPLDEDTVRDRVRSAVEMRT